MNATEAAAWKAETASSQHSWKLDPCHATPTDLLLYRGGIETGHFAMVHDTTVTVGTYVDAYPHIGEATFTVQCRRAFPTNDVAVKFLLERGGIGMLLSFVSC